MATQDDDTLTGSVPEPEAEPTPTELAHARRFAELVDKTLSGSTPPAMSADDRALLEVTTVLRATHGSLELTPSKQRSLVEDALRQSIGEARSRGVGTPTALPAGRGSSPVGSIGAQPTNAASVVPIARARARRWAPWIVAGASTLVAGAAVAMLWLRTPGGAGEAGRAGGNSSVTRRAEAPGWEAGPLGMTRGVPAEWMSRPADSLVGPIARDHAGDASARLDTIFADRLDGFRARRLSRGGKR